VSAGLGREDILLLLDELSNELSARGAARVENDAQDIMFLYRQLGFTTVEEGLDLVESVYHGRRLEAKVQFLLAEIVEAMREADQ